MNKLMVSYMILKKFEHIYIQEDTDFMIRIWKDSGRNSDKFESFELKLIKKGMSLINKKSDKVSLIFGNFFHTTIEGPCVVFCNNLCLGNELKRLSQKFNKELKPGDLLIVTKPMPLLREI